MDEVRIIEIKKSIFDDNDKDANRLREELKTKGVFLLNLMSPPGTGLRTTPSSAREFKFLCTVALPIFGYSSATV